MTLTDRFSHEALLYEGADEFVDSVGAFVREGSAAGDPVFVVVAAQKIGWLKDSLGGAAGRVQFADMAEVGSNPARIIPAWRDFVATNGPSGRPLWGVGEPIGPDRTTDELVECERHEALLNVAFCEAPSFRLLCPYDVEVLDDDVIAEARRNHPFVGRGPTRGPSDDFPGLDAVARPCDRELPAPAADRTEVAFDATTRMITIRRAVADHAEAAGLGLERVDELVLAVNELATNSVRHGGGRGVLKMWDDEHSVVCEVSDPGKSPDVLAGRARPMHSHEGGRGLWLVHQLCDLVQLRAFATGNVIRVHVNY